MNSLVKIVLNAFLSEQSEEKRACLIRFLPEADRETISELPVRSAAITPEDLTNTAILEKVHWSWFFLFLKSYGPQEQSVFLAALDPPIAKALVKEIPCKKTHKKLTRLGKKYLREMLLNSLISPSDRLLPQTYFPESSINILLEYSKRQLVMFIDLLSMYDLGISIRQIVENKVLKKIYDFLNDIQKKILKQIIGKTEPHILLTIDFDNWDGTEAWLSNILHRRGLARLGLALSGKNSSLIWHICHRLDIGRGSALMKFSIGDYSHSAAELALAQVEELLRKDIY